MDHRWALARPAPGGARGLTRRERMVAEWAGRGWANKEIGLTLGPCASPSTTTAAPGGVERSITCAVGVAGASAPSSGGASSLDGSLASSRAPAAHCAGVRRRSFADSADLRS
jgi:hypothetical protein